MEQNQKERNADKQKETKKEIQTDIGLQYIFKFSQFLTRRELI